MSWTEAAAVDVTELATAEEGNGFAALGLPGVLVGALASQGITTPFPIQAATIPDALAGRDVLGRGQTGSGKTLGFGLPMLSRLADGPRGRTRGVVLVPTRELAMQVADVLSPLASTVGLSVVLVAGGMAYGPQLKAFDRGVDVVVATPGRLIDLMDQGAADLSSVEITVLDEADHMADLGFLPDVRRVLDSVPPTGQRLLFSATLDRGVDTVVREYLDDPVTHEVDSGQATVSTMAHHVFQVKPYEKQTITAEVANREGRTVLFVRTQRGADRVASQLREVGVMAGALHGGLTQGARSRILSAFKEGTVPVLVATDVAARGIHVDEVSLVLQVDPPMGPKDYLHRAGRTARAGGEGAVVTLSLPHQRREVARLVKQAGVATVAQDVSADDEQVYRATGARKPSRPAIEDAEYERMIAPPVKARGSRRPGGQFRGRGRAQGGRQGGGRPRGGHRPV
ncbi:DEAD/DEAH box helicase [Auraticoccus cholistanensis]|nr:DEAD/DEAH box helicase [Auraticoccus cholistanensis]